MAKKRTNVDVMAARPITVELGSKQYAVKPIPFGLGTVWMEKLAEFQKTASRAQAIENGEDTDATADEHLDLAIDLRRQMLALVVDYMKPSPAELEQINSEATGKQIGAAIRVLSQVANDFS